MRLRWDKERALLATCSAFANSYLVMPGTKLGKWTTFALNSLLNRLRATYPSPLSPWHSIFVSGPFLGVHFIYVFVGRLRPPATPWQPISLTFSMGYLYYF